MWTALSKDVPVEGRACEVVYMFLKVQGKTSRAFVYGGLHFSEQLEVM